MELKGIKGIDTFVQNTEPSTKYSGDVWIRPGKQSKLVWSRDKWNRPFWKDVVSKILWGAGCEYGYVCGGLIYDESYINYSIIDRITFPFDSGTASHVGNLSGSRYSGVGCNSSNYGFSLGGHTYDSSHINYSTIDRITFPFDSGTASHVGSLSGSRYVGAGCNSSNYGYSLGGKIYVSSTNNFSIIDRITFPFDSGTATYVGNLNGSRSVRAGCNSSNYGYSLGGSTHFSSSNHFSIIDRITFPFDSGTASHVGNLSGSRNHGVGCNSSNYGFSLGGDIQDSSHINYSIIDRITFPFDSGPASHVGNLSGSRYNEASCNSSNYSYSSGGKTYDSSTMYYSIIDRITFPFDSGTATHVGNLSGSRFSGTGVDGTDFCTLFVD